MKDVFYPAASRSTTLNISQTFNIHMPPASSQPTAHNTSSSGERTRETTQATKKSLLVV